MPPIAPPVPGSIAGSAEKDAGRLPVAAAARRSGALILAVWWIFLGTSNFLWLERDTRPPHWDAAVHLLSSLGYRRIVMDFGKGNIHPGQAVARLFSVDAFYPPFAPFMSALLSPGSRPSAALSTWILNQFFLALLILGTFRLGRRLGSSDAGVAAAVAVGSFGGIWSASHAFMLDLPLAAVTALALDALLATERFGNTGRSLLFGLLCGIGMLTKWTFVLFLLVPVGAELAVSFRSRDRLWRLRNAGGAFLVSGAIALPWYLVHAPNLAQDFLGFGGFSGNDWRRFPGVWSAESLAFYPRSLAILLLLPWSCALAVGVVLCWRRRPEIRRLALLSLGALVFLTLIRVKNVRYAMPLVPAAAVIATAWTDDPRLGRRVRSPILGVLTLASLLLAFRADPAVRQRWPIEDALAAVPQSSSGPPACVRVVPDLPEFHRFAFEYAARAAGRNVEIAGGGRLPWFTDAVIVKTGEQGAHPEAAKTMASITRDEGSFHEIFRKAWEGPLPDGSRTEVYVRDVRPIPGIPPAEVVEMLRAAVRREVERNIHTRFFGRVEVETLSDAETLRGRFRRVRISAEDLRVGEKPPAAPPLLVREMACDLFGVWVNPYRLKDGELQLLSLDALAPRVRLSEEDVNAWLAARPGRLGARIRFEGGAIRALIRGKGGPSAELVLRPRIVAGSNVGVDFEALRVAGIRLPVFPLSLAASQYKPMLKQMPCRVRIATLRCDRGTFTLEEGVEPGIPAPGQS